jgi:catechol 2,3-dioxygenase-like lactoylglutathione lyase family enzyme
MIRGIDHIELIVRDFDEYLAFLQSLGMEVLTHTTHHGQSAELKAPGENQPIFEIHEASGEEVIGVNHIAFRVEDVNGAAETLGDTAIKHNPPNYVESTGRTTINLRDPDGWRMQLVDAKRADPS